MINIFHSIYEAIDYSKASQLGELALLMIFVLNTCQGPNSIRLVHQTFSTVFTHL